MIVPIASPIIKGFGFDIVWFCVVFLVVLQTAYLTPPMAPSIFYLRGIARPEIELKHRFPLDVGVEDFQLVGVVVSMAPQHSIEVG